MNDIGAINTQYYYFGSGVKSATASYIYKLDRTIDADILAQATADVVKRYHYFKLRPFLDEKGSLVFRENDVPPRVFPDDGTVLNLGTDETDGYMFRVLYGDDYIRVMAFHGMADGRGINAFGLSIVYQYLTLCGIDMEPEGMVVTPDTPVDATETDDFISRCTEAAAGMESAEAAKYKCDRVFVTPEDHEFYGTGKSKKVKITWRAGDLIDLCHRVNGTPVTVLSALIGMAMHRIFTVGDDVIAPNVPVDLRPILNSAAQSNFTTNITLPYRNEYVDLPIEEQVEALREMLGSQTKKELLVSGMDGFAAFIEGLKQIPLHDEDALDAFHKKMAAGTKANTTYLLTNVGVFRVPSKMQPHVLDFDGIAPNLEYSPVYALMTMGDSGRLIISQNSESVILPEEIVRILGEYGVAAELEDHGPIWTDSVRPHLFSRI
ncbi:MAG: hypothetical protein J5819_01820 [Eubacterium sp.]|nr:hypothetical protein [Eubacterium sp.]